MLCCIKRSLGVTVPSLEKFRSTLSAKQQSNKKSTVGVRLLKAKFEKEWGGGGERVGKQYKRVFIQMGG